MKCDSYRSNFVLQNINYVSFNMEELEGKGYVSGELGYCWFVRCHLYVQPEVPS